MYKQLDIDIYIQIFVVYRTFGQAWISMLKVHENIGNQRMKFAATISDTAEDLISLSRHIEKDRKKVIVIKKGNLSILWNYLPS
jgi:hypothetical protein